MIIKPHTEKIVIFIGAAISTFLFFVTLSYEIEKEKSTFLSEANSAFNKVEAVFESLKRINTEFASRFYLVDELSKDEFTFFAKSRINQNNFIEEIVFAEKVALKNKLLYELSIRNEGYAGFKVKPFSEPVLISSLSPDILFPVKFIEPFNVKNSRWFGRDILTYSDVKNALELTKYYSNALAYAPISDDHNKVYAVRALYGGHSDRSNNKKLRDVFGVILYKINFDHLIPMDKNDYISIVINENIVWQEGAVVFTGLFENTYTLVLNLGLLGHVASVKFERTKGFLSSSIIYPMFAFCLGLLLTGAVWFIIRSHVKINILLFQQNKIIENEVRDKTSKLNTKAEELTAAYHRQLMLTGELESFCHSVSHDLRAPLRSINGFSQILNEDYGEKLDEEATTCLTRICAAAEKMGSIIDDLLNLSRIARTKFTTQYINLSEIVDKSLLTLRGYDSARKVSVTIQKDMFCHGDAKFLQIGIDNLMSNAWKYSSTTPKPEIEFGVEQQEGENVFFIRDNGAGFDMRYKNKLFVAFQRLHKTSEFEGVGVGLATVQRIIHKHNGKIWANSTVGEGSVFYFTLGDVAESLNR
ncbi:MAG: CHASE domain-containing protein [Ectothiorhodospiraceae bacterium]|nr:CHASE domain-containing protein [Ectothiorhodospiraceae bacterium]